MTHENALSPQILIAGQDRTRDIMPRLHHEAARREHGPKPQFLPPELSALTLRESRSDADYLRQLIRLIRIRDAVDTLDFEIPRRPGLIPAVLARIRAFLWRALRYQHDRIAFRQNMINGLLTSALEFELLERDREVHALRARLDDLERRLGAAPARTGGEAKPS